MDLWLLSCILLKKSMNLLYIILMRMITVIEIVLSFLIYANIFSKIFEEKKRRVDVGVRSRKLS